MKVASFIGISPSLSAVFPLIIVISLSAKLIMLPSKTMNFILPHSSIQGDPDARTLPFRTEGTTATGAAYQQISPNTQPHDTPAIKLIEKLQSQR